MALTDWTQEQDAGSQGATPQESYDGNYSYLLDGASGDPRIYLDKSANDKPAEGKVKTYLKHDGGNFLVRTRWQTDSVAVSMDFGTGEVQLYNTGKSGKDTFNASLSPPGQWDLYEVTFWGDSGTMSARLEINGTQVGNDLGLSNPMNSNGKIGFRCSNGKTHIDETAVFY